VQLGELGLGQIASALPCFVHLDSYLKLDARLVNRYDSVLCGEQ